MRVGEEGENVSTHVMIIGSGSYRWGLELIVDPFGVTALSGMQLVATAGTAEWPSRFA
jgi:hypothetical protein